MSSNGRSAQLRCSGMGVERRLNRSCDMRRPSRMKSVCLPIYKVYYDGLTEVYGDPRSALGAAGSILEHF